MPRRKINKNKKITYGFKTDVSDLRTKEERYKLYQQLVKKTNEKTERMVKNLSSDSKEVQYINHMIDKASAVKSSKKLVDRSGKFVRTDNKGIRKLVTNKEAFMNLNIYQQKALINSIQKLNTNESYGAKSFSVKGVKSFFNRNETKMRQTLRAYILGTPEVEEYNRRCRENGENPESVLKEIEDRAVQRIYDAARSGNSYSSEQITEEASTEVLALYKEISEEEARKINNNRMEEYDRINKAFEQNKNSRGGKVR